MDVGYGSSWCEQLYGSRSAGLLLYGRSLGLSHAEAEDVLQETFRALLKLEAAPNHADRYMLRAFRNRALNHRRSLVRRISREFESKRWFDAPKDISEQEEKAMCQLATLPRPMREVIVLKIWHKHTFEEIGKLLDISPNTAAGRYRNGMLKLRATLRNTKEDYYEQRRPGENRGTDATVGSEGPVEPHCTTSLLSPAGG